jgi:hypothetical protein
VRERGGEGQGGAERREAEASGHGDLLRERCGDCSTGPGAAQARRD